MKFKQFLPLALATGFAIAPTFAATPALAQSYGADATDAAIGAAVGALVGSLLFDSNRNQYYYYEGGRHVYVSNDYAGHYFSRRDPEYWRGHQHDFYQSREHFAHEWNGAHGPDQHDGGNWHRGDGGDRQHGGNWHHSDGGDRQHGDGGDRPHGDAGDWHHSDGRDQH